MRSTRWVASLVAAGVSLWGSRQAPPGRAVRVALSRTQITFPLRSVPGCSLMAWWVSKRAAPPMKKPPRR